MKRIYIAVSILLYLISFSHSLHAQVDNTTITEKIEKIEKLQQKNEEENKKAPERTVTDGGVPMQGFTSDQTIFGSELFSANSLVFEPNLRIPTPSNYILGPDDEVIINVFGYSEQTYNLTVNEEGNIYIPNIGPLYVNGLSIEDASIKIKSKLASTIYKGINSGATSVQISLGKIRSIRVTVIGEARKPGTYTVSSLTTLFNLLYLCGGPSEMGSFRNIELIRGNQVKRKVDIYNFLTKGDLKDNVLLEELDVIRIPFYQNRVTLSGQVKRQGKYELLPGETFEQLLAYAGGFADGAYRASISVTQLTDEDKKIIDIPALNYNSYRPISSDLIVVGGSLNRFANRVIIEGAVLRPGAFELKEGMSLKDLIDKAGGLRGDAYMQRGLITRFKEDMTRTTLAFTLPDIVKGSEVIKLQKEDIVTITSIDDMKDKYTVSIDGEVHRPGIFPWTDNFTLKDLIFQAGDFSDAANTVSIEISRRIKNAEVGKAQFKQAEIFTVDLKEGLSGNAKNMVLQPFDVVSVRPLSGYGEQRAVFVSGEVMNRGKYVLLTNHDRLSDLVNRFGGFRSSADSVNITLRRVLNTGISGEARRTLFERLLNMNEDSLKTDSKFRTELYKNYDIVNINVREAIEDTTSSSNLILEDGDYLSVERSSTLIRVGGEVYYPTLLPYQEGASVKHYLNNSGNITENAQKSSAMVIYPDGRAKTVGKFLFFKSYPTVLPRSEIFVPARSKTPRKKFISTTELLSISSILVTLGTVLVTAFRK